MAPTLTQWLGTRTPEQIAEVLAARPDVAEAPTPRHLRELAERLEAFDSVAAAAHALPLPAIQVIEVLQLLGPGQGDRAALAGWLGRAGDDPDLAATLELLAAWAMVWPDGDTLHMAQPLYATFRHPLNLGPPAAVLLSGYPAAQLRTIARSLGVPAPGRKQELVEALAAALGDAERVRKLVAGAGAKSRAAVAQLADEGPPGPELANWYGYYRYQPDPDLRWALECGLAVTTPPGLPQVPREVAMALRGEGWHAPFTPRPPWPALAEVDAAAVEREAAAAGSAAVEQLTALLEEIGTTPVSLLKAGGVGVKELRRLARVLRLDEGTVRLWLELAYEAELLAPVRERKAGSRAGRGGRTDPGTAVLLPTTGYDEWAATEPADRLAALLPVWAALPTAPLQGPPDGETKPPPALVREHPGETAVTARSHVIGLAADLPAGRGIGGGTALAEVACWHSPLVLALQPDADGLVDAAWREAQLVGAVAHGAITPIGRALAGGSTGQLAEACRRLLPAAVDEAIFQADLTALVPGTPTSSLTELLDTAADREARGGAVTWRFSAGSVRRALDEGQDADNLLTALRDRAAGGTLPQPLEYLVADVARRHGAVRVRAVTCVLRADDPALLAEIAGARALRSLRLSVIAPTVLGSAAPVAETLAALRDAGYAPVGESADGAPQLARVEPRRARPPGRRRPISKPAQAPPPSAGPIAPASPEGTPASAGPIALATALLAAPVPPPPPAPGRAPAQRHATDLPELERQLQARGFLGLPDLEDADEEDGDDVEAALEYRAAQLDPDQRRLLADAIESAEPVEISYTDAQGDRSHRVIEPLELDGARLVAWCRLRDDERVFALGRIASVAPA